MRPMSLFESQNSTGEVSLRSLFKKSNKIHSVTEVSLEDYAYLLCRGGWPQIMQLSKKNALHLANNFYDGLVNEDINKVCDLLPPLSLSA